MFWSGETLVNRLEQFIEPFDEKRVDCAAYTLSVGSEVYITPNDQCSDPSSVTINKLGHKEAFSIPPGQFAFIITEEVVSVPDEALAFISIRARTKFRGLVNVSGFHVDPGYKGQLTFSVFNAGPVPIHLKQGDPIFLIWYADLDQATSHKKRDETVHRGIKADTISAVAGELHSFAGLIKKIDELDVSLTKRIQDLELAKKLWNALGLISIGLIVGVFLYFMANVLLIDKSAPSDEPIVRLENLTRSSDPRDNDHNEHSISAVDLVDQPGNQNRDRQSELTSSGSNESAPLQSDEDVNAP